jgi:hypothetical protein
LKKNRKELGKFYEEIRELFLIKPNIKGHLITREAFKNFKDAVVRIF